jgi:glucosamine--fructose-6-phosphate aminotransferase (isomerizing)
LVNTVASTIARKTHAGVYNHAGPEISVASTKAFTSQIAALFLIYATIKQIKSELNKKDKELLKDLLRIPDIFKKEIRKIDLQARKIAEKIYTKEHLYSLGRGKLFPIASEAALKIKEISYIHAESYPAGELKHGPIALVEKAFPALFFLDNSALYEKTLSNIEEVKARRATIISVGYKKMKEARKLSDYFLSIPEISSEASVLLYALPLQLLAYYLAKNRGLNVDKPRNLAKSVTVE